MLININGIEKKLDKMVELGDIDYEAFVEIIAWCNQNQIDAEPIRHGHWIDDAETGDLRCSVCGHYTCEIQDTWGEADEELSIALGIPVGTKYIASGSPKYCSKCGAYMREEQE